MIKGDYRKVSGLMGEMHGFPQKLGQHLTLYRGDPFDRYFKDLCTASRTEDVNITEVLGELQIEAGKFEISAQASIGQVYRVEAGAGVLAVKVKYPGVEERIRSDFRTLKTVLWPVRVLPLKNSSLFPLLEQMKLLVLAECDYRREAEVQKAFQELFGDDPDITVPEIITYNERAIASKWVDGTGLVGCTGWLDGWFIETYLKFILTSLRELGMIHADPHPGNFILTGANGRKLAVLDYGSAVMFNTREAGAAVRLLAGEYGDEAELLDDLRILGIDEESLHIYRPIIGDLVSILLEPFYSPGPYDFSDWRMQYRINTLMSSRAWEKPLLMSPKLLLLVRTIQGLYFYARENSVIFDWHKAVSNYLG